MTVVAKNNSEEDYICPHCNQPLTHCNTPPFHVGDGLGWGADTFYICLNDDCSLFVRGWDYIETQYGHVGSYRYMRIAGSKEATPMFVGSPDAFKGCIIDSESQQEDDERFKQEKAAVKALDTCVTERNLAPILHLLLDEASTLGARERACDLLVEMNDLGVIDPIRNHTFRNTSIEQRVNLAIAKILHASHKKECPFCLEIIKAHAVVCKHCGRELKAIPT